MKHKKKTIPFRSIVILIVLSILLSFYTFNQKKSLNCLSPRSQIKILSKLFPVLSRFSKETEKELLFAFKHYYSNRKNTPGLATALEKCGISKKDLEAFFQFITNEVMQARLSKHEFETFNTSGGMMMVYDSKTLPGVVIKVPRQEIDFENDVLPGYSIAKNNLGELFAQMLLTNVTVKINGRTQHFEHLIVQTKVNIFYDIFYDNETEEMKELDQESIKMLNHYVHSYLAICHQFWLRGVYDWDIENWFRNYGQDIFGNIRGIDVNQITKSKRQYLAAISQQKPKLAELFEGCEGKYKKAVMDLQRILEQELSPEFFKTYSEEELRPAPEYVQDPIFAEAEENIRVNLSAFINDHQGFMGRREIERREGKGETNFSRNQQIIIFLLSRMNNLDVATLKKGLKENYQIDENFLKTYAKKLSQALQLTENHSQLKSQLIETITTASLEGDMELFTDPDLKNFLNSLDLEWNDLFSFLPFVLEKFSNPLSLIRLIVTRAA